MKKTVLISGLTVAMLAGCGELKKVDDMHDDTQKMAETTGKMSKTTSQMNDTTGQMNKTTAEMNQTTAEMNNKMQTLQDKMQALKNTMDELYDTLRQGNAAQLRRDGYKAILEAPTLYKKVSEAYKYFMAFEFQLWNAQGQDLDEGARQKLGQQAAQEFYMEIEGLGPRDKSISVTAQPDPKDISSKENRLASFNAMAAGMHQINRKENRAQAMTKDLKTMSMYTMTQEALMASHDQEQTGYIREIQAHEDKAIQLIQTRISMFPLIFIDAVARLGEMNKIEQAKMAYVGWDFEIDKYSATQLEYLQTEVIGQALEAKAFLKKIGIKPVMDSTVLHLLKNMKVKNTKTNQTPAMAASQTKLLGMIADLQKD
ncbi:MAG TPA: DUF948 domain-containing protein [Bdellovibrio sp.]|uniref:DUF948 domain-containing protein n=1 Tax=Bdellovibrio sp. TaxID=28201 RepID=UPI002F0E3A93